MTEEFIIEAADNGMTVRAEEYFEVFENTHVDNNSNSKDNVCFQLGKLFHDTIEQTMNEIPTNIVRMKIEITEADD